MFMADNVLLNLGVGGDSIAADEIDVGGTMVKFPRCKITLGADGVNENDVSSINPMPILNAPATAFAGTGQDPIDNVAFNLNAGASKVALRGVIVKAMGGNSGKIYVGSSAGVTTGDGFELIPGDAVSLPLNNINLIWCISDTVGQKVSWAVV
jgi:hypothetical protein